MKLPSIKTLSLVFEDAKQARKILEMSHKELASTDAGRKRIAECYHHPAWYDVRLTVLNSIDPGLHGVEGIESNNGEWVTYLNAGDTYTPTIIYWRGRYRVQSIGDFIEAMEKRSIHFS